MRVKLIKQTERRGNLKYQFTILLNVCEFGSFPLRTFNKRIENRLELEYIICKLIKTNQTKRVF